MIGNDVVDLRDPDADFASFSPRFDARVFSASERQQIKASADPEACRWRLWAAKEAVFKAARKADPGMVFSPRRFEVRSPGSDFREAEVRVESARSERFEVRFFFDATSLHAVALCPGWSEAKIVHGCERMATRPADAPHPDEPGRAARRLAVERLAPALALHGDSLEIRRENRVPVLFESGRPVKGNLSLSHHGDWVAFAFESAVTTGEAAG